MIGGKVGGMDMVSFGPQIEGAHSPDERLDVTTVPRFFTGCWPGVVDEVSRTTLCRPAAASAKLHPSRHGRLA